MRGRTTLAGRSCGRASVTPWTRSAIRPGRIRSASPAQAERASWGSCRGSAPRPGPALAAAAGGGRRDRTGRALGAAGRGCPGRAGPGRSRRGGRRGWERGPVLEGRRPSASKRAGRGLRVCENIFHIRGSPLLLSRDPAGRRRGQDLSVCVCDYRNLACVARAHRDKSKIQVTWTRLIVTTTIALRASAARSQGLAPASDVA